MMGAWLCLALAAGSRPPVIAQPTVRIRADRAAVGMGRTVTLTARVTDARGKPFAGQELWPYVDGKRWGAQAFTDARGVAAMPLPLPNPGHAVIQVVLRPPAAEQTARWIWSAATSDHQTVFLGRSFTLRTAPVRAVLYITCDDVFTAYLNGKEVASGSNFQKVQRVSGLERLLKPGRNVLAVESRNGTGPAGLLAQIDAGQARPILATDSRWRVSAEKPAGWPMPPASHGAPAQELAKPGDGPWGSSIAAWPGVSPKNSFPVGQPMPASGPRSNVVTVRVDRRQIVHERDPDHLVGMEWEPWFTPLNVRWDTAEAVPVVGYYDSYDRDVIRQHALWMTGAGIDFLLVDWSNNLWDKKHWAERAPGVNELIRGTTLMLDVYSEMLKEGIPVPQVTLLLGLDNGPQTTTTALNEEMRWVYDHYVTNPKYKGLWLYHEGKPLIVPFNGGGPPVRAGQPPVDDALFTVRWMASQLQANHLEREGYWSWMDGVVHPIPTYHDGKCEALTVTPAFFGDGGWTYPQALGRRAGATYLEEFRTALQELPKFLLINQWNEFAGQPDGGGYGPKRDQFVDTYSPELSDDIEPTSLTAPAYRGKGGWGYYYLNLTRALVDLYHGAQRNTALVAISDVERHGTASGGSLLVRLTTLGDPGVWFRVLLDGKEVLKDVHGDTQIVEVPLRGVGTGTHVLTVESQSPATRWSLSSATEDDALPTPVPARASVWFTIPAQPGGSGGA